MFKYPFRLLNTILFRKEIVMKILCSIVLLAAFAVLVSSCVSREVTTNSPLKKGEKNVVEKKIIWIWQDEFRNP